MLVINISMTEGRTFLKYVRQKELIDTIQNQGYINAAAAAKKFGVSIATIRRDLNQLEHQGLLEKKYGGAKLPPGSSINMLPFALRQSHFHSSKAAIAAAALKHIPDGATIALDAGSTLFEVALRLNEKNNLVIISSDVISANEMLKHEKNQVYMMGGFLTKDGSSSGDFAEDFINKITNIDIFLCSCDGANPKYGISNENLNISNLKSNYMKKARKTIALIDHSKFSQNAFYKMCDFSEIDLLITDSATPDEILNELRVTGVNIEIAKEL